MQLKRKFPGEGIKRCKNQILVKKVFTTKLVKTQFILREPGHQMGQSIKINDASPQSEPGEGEMITDNAAVRS